MLDAYDLNSIAALAPLQLPADIAFKNRNSPRAPRAGEAARELRCRQRRCGVRKETSNVAKKRS